MTKKKIVNKNSSNTEAHSENTSPTYFSDYSTGIAFTDTDTLSILSGINKYVTPKRTTLVDFAEDFLQDKKEEDEEEENVPIPHSYRWEKTSKPSPKNLKDFKDLIMYLNSDNFTYFLKFLVKNGILREGTNCVIYNPDMPSDMENSCKFSSKMMYSEIKQYISHYNSAYPDSSISLPTDFYTKLCSLLKEIYLLKNKSKLFIVVDTLECFREVITTCINKGIKIEPCLLEDKYDFMELRKEGKVLRMAYFGNINELILVSREENSPIESLYYFYKCLKDLPDVIQQNNNQEETVEIEGKKYSKSAFISMIECDFDSFMVNLEFESSMTNIKNATKEIKEKELL